MILDGRVEVDGHVVTEMGTRVDPATAEIRVDGARIVLDDTMVYLAVNKPRGMHSTMSDDRGRPCIGDLVEHRVRATRSCSTSVASTLTPRACCSPTTANWRTG